MLRHGLRYRDFKEVFGQVVRLVGAFTKTAIRSEEHTSELQSRLHLVCRLLLEKKKEKQKKKKIKIKIS